VNGHDRFRAAARAYFVYGVIYLIGGLYLVAHGVGVRGSRVVAGIEWFVVGLVLLVGIPFLLRRPRAWFERWIVTRRDFARILAALLTYRAFKVGQIALKTDSGSVAAPWTGVISFRVGAALFFAVTVTALVFVVLAAWGSERAEATEATPA
jgi:hypothetical protein